MELYGDLSGTIGLDGGGADVTITPTLTSGTKIADYEIDGEGGSLYAPTPTSLTAELPLSISNNTISIDLSDYATQSDISDFVTDTELSTVLEDYTTYQYTESRYTPLATFNSYTISAESHFQKTLTAGENITIDPVTNVISASGGGGGGLDLPTDGSPVAIGTFGSMTLYAQSVSVSANTYNLCRFWTGQAGDIVLSANAIAVCNNNPPTKMVVPSSITNIVSFSWYTDDYEALPHLSIYSTLDSNLWSGGATIKGMVIFAR